MKKRVIYGLSIDRELKDWLFVNAIRQGKRANELLEEIILYAKEKGFFEENK